MLIREPRLSLSIGSASGTPVQLNMNDAVTGMGFER
jgi:hypothetical protein